EVVAANDRDHRAEDLFLRNAHLGIDVDEYRRFHEPAVLQLALVEAITAADQPGALIFSDVNIAEVSFELSFVDRRTHVHRFVKPVPHLEAFGAMHIALDELVVNALLHDDAAGRSATLTGGAESAPQASINCEIKV